MNKPVIYQKANGVQRRDASEIIEKYIHLIKWKTDGKDKVLDIGCGSGDVTFDLIRPKLPKNFDKLVGSDISEKMIEHAKEMYENEENKMEFITLDISKKLEVELEENFDHIFSFYCLHWVQEQRQAIENMYNLLKPGGDILLCFLAKNPIYEVYNNMSKTSRWKIYMEDVQKFISPYQKEEDPQKTIQEILEDVGFKADICECPERTYIYPNLDILRKSVKAVTPFLDRIPEEKREEFLVDYVNEIRQMKFIEENNNEKGEKIFVPYRLATVYARKPI